MKQKNKLISIQTQINLALVIGLIGIFLGLFLGKYSVSIVGTIYFTTAWIAGIIISYIDENFIETDIKR